MYISLRLLFVIGLAHSLVGNCQAADVTDSPRPSTVTRIISGGREACLVNPPSKPTETALSIVLPLLASLGGKAAESAHDALADYIAETIKADSKSLTIAVQSTYFYRMKKSAEGKWGAEPSLDCIVIARGRPGPMDAPGLRLFAAKVDPKSRFSKIDANGDRAFSVLQALGFSDFPDLYLEFAFERDSLDTVFRLQPRVIYYKQASVKPTPDGKVDLNLTVSFSEPGHSSPSAVLPFRVPEVQVGSDTPVESIGVDNPWAPMLSPPDEKLSDSSRAKLFSSFPAAPTNLTVTLEETGSAGRFLVFLSRFVNSSKSDVGNSAADILKQLVTNAASKEPK
jgi:hypothetical protein